jgi:PhnB protein
MAQLVPYINFAGKTSEALDFYKSIFGGEADVQLAKDGPMAAQTPPERQSDVFHADYNAGGFRLLASDMMSDAAGRVVGNVYSLALMCDSAEQLQEWFDKLADGGNVVWPVRDSEWGSIYAQVVDKYGLQWMLNYDKPKSE